MKKLHQAKSLLQYFFKAKTKYQIHSPFLFELIDEVLEDDRIFYAFQEIEAYRNYLVQNNTQISVTDLGAGSSVGNSGYKRSIRSIAKSAVSPQSQCEFLFRLIQHYKPEIMLELGTSLGVNTLYQAMGNVNGKMITMEGCKETANIAFQSFQKLKANNVGIVLGNFDEKLPETLKKLPKLDYVFFDGNHRKKPTLSYFEQCLSLAHNDSIFIFDDIHWSKEMKEAWEEIKKHPSVTLSLDLYYMGMVFFRKENVVKEHFTVIPSKYKPWIMGFFSS